jgi:HAD superfamily hydrolase (TIGR01509 family)
MTQPKKKNLKVLIFDLDGVLVDSQKNMFMAINEINKKMNLNIHFEEYKKFLGLPFEQIMKKLSITKNVKIVKKKYQFYSCKYINKICINKNLLIELKTLKKNYLLSVFTSKDRLRSLKILKKYKLFDYLVTSDDVREGKPNPEGLTKIMKKFKVTRKECIFW